MGKSYLQVHTTNLELRNYSSYVELSIVNVLSQKEVSPQTIKRIMETSDTFNLGVVAACTHRLAKIADILETIEKFNNQENRIITARQKQNIKTVLDHLYKHRRNHLDSHFYRVHDTDTRELPTMLLDNLLGV
jgi:hypothetical protein